MLSRRDFLATTALAAYSQVAWASDPQSLGSLSLAPETGLFEATAGCDVAAQVDLAAEWGFPAFTDPQLLSRPVAAAGQIMERINRWGLVSAPVLGTACPALSSGSCNWDRDIRSQIVQSRRWQIPGLRIDVGPSASLHDASMSVIRWLNLADYAMQFQVTLLLEPWDDGRATRAVFLENVELVRRLAHPAVKLSVDTYRWAAAGVSLTAVFREVADIIGHVELADFPGGCEPGSGQLPLAECLQYLSRSNYSGIIGLRHGVSQSGSAGDQAVLHACERLMWDVGHSTNSDERRSV